VCCVFILGFAFCAEEYRDALYKDVIAGSRRHRKSSKSPATADSKEKKDRKAERKAKKEVTNKGNRFNGVYIYLIL
jgi:hypothetical protein